MISLKTACCNGNLDEVRLLLPDMTTEEMNHQDHDGKTALHYAVGHRHGDVGVFLLDHGASADTMDTYGETPLMTACSKGLLGVVQRAVQQLPADRVNCQDQFGRTALYYAVFEGYEDMGIFMLDHGASADTVDTYGKTPFMRACNKGLLGVVQRAVQQLPALRLNHQDHFGETALHYAVNGDKGEVVRVLLYAGADPDIMRNDGRTPCMIAEEDGRFTCITVLRVSTRIHTLAC
jgi:ankyrin repeat protein